MIGASNSIATEADAHQTPDSPMSNGMTANVDYEPAQKHEYDTHYVSKSKVCRQVEESSPKYQAR